MVNEDDDIIEVQAFTELSKVANNIDDRNMMIINKIVEYFLKENNYIIEAAFKNGSMQGSLHYAIVLRRDSLINRNSIFRFFEKYDLSKYANRYPVYFQFIPKALVSKMQAYENIEIS